MLAVRTQAIKSKSTAVEVPEISYLSELEKKLEMFISPSNYLEEISS